MLINKFPEANSDQNQWRSIASEVQVASIKKLLPRLVERVVSTVDVNNLSLTSGLCGKLIFLSEVGRYDANLVSQNTIDTLSQTLLSNTSNYAFDASFSRGLAGLGWTLDFLGFSQSADFNQDIDECLLAILDKEVWQGEYEFLYGLVGIGNYALCRTDVSSEKSLGLSIARKVLHHLFALKRDAELKLQSYLEKQQGVYWETRPNSYFFSHKQNPSSTESASERSSEQKSELVNQQQLKLMPEKNLGTAHGNVSVMAFLIKMLEKGVERETVKPLLSALCRWFVEQQLNPAEAGGGYFPSVVGNTRTSRMGWCYGDLSTSLILLRAAHVLDDQNLLGLASEVVKLTTHRTPENGMVECAGLCHGSGGISVIYQHIGEYYAAPEMHQAAKYWLKHTLDLAQQKDDLSDLLQSMDRLPDEVQETYQHSDFLMGYAGIGLSLLSAISKAPTRWGSALLLR